MPHVIRLRGPWDYEPLARFVTQADGSTSMTNKKLPPSGVIDLPADWASVFGADFQGRVRFTRRFHRPTGLEASSRVRLVIDDIDWQADVALNDSVLGAVIYSQSVESPNPQRCPARFDITTLLSPQNRLSIVVTSPTLDADNILLPRPGRVGHPGGLIGLVRLEID
jgi:hypothetical protein